MAGIATGATVGARAGTNLVKADGSTSIGDADMLNDQISVADADTSNLLRTAGTGTIAGGLATLDNTDSAEVDPESN